MGSAEIFRVCYLECLLYPICLVTALAFEVFHTCLFQSVTFSKNYNFQSTQAAVAAGSEVIG